MMVLSKRCFLVVFLTLVGVLSASTQAEARRLALVIGNGDYNVGPLKNPVADARLISNRLEQVGFEAKVVLDADLREMKRAIRAFAEDVARNPDETVALFYFAGHGIQMDGRNFLVPVDAAMRARADVEFEAIDAQWALNLLGETAPATTIFILDACRNNPFRSLARSASRGLAQMQTARGTILSFATGPGKVALDGAGNNSPFSAALGDAIVAPGMKVEDAFKQVRRSVMDRTGDQQIPWETTSLTGDFYFSAPVRPVKPVVIAPAPVKKADPAVAAAPKIAETTPTEKIPATGANPPFFAICGSGSKEGQFDHAYSNVSLADAYAKASDRWASCPYLQHAANGNCLSVARATTGAWGWNTRLDRAAAEAAAIKNCEKHGRKCQTRETYCTSPTGADEGVLRDGAEGGYLSLCGVGALPHEYAVAYSDVGEEDAKARAKRLWPYCANSYSAGPGQCIGIAMGQKGAWQWSRSNSSGAASSRAKQLCEERGDKCEILEVFCTN